MTILFTPNHYHHYPKSEIFNGEIVSHSEVPSRIENILVALQSDGYKFEPVKQATYSGELQKNLEEIHNQEYLNWLRHLNIQSPIYPSVFNQTSTFLLHGHPSIHWGNFCTDMFTPLMSQTWQQALDMAQASLYAAQLLITHQESTVIVIGRPPGHHAGRTKVGGYCYLNNAAVAAHYLATKGRVAILDVDYHHGNGTQDIFYNSSDVLTASIHAHPSRKFPYFSGFEGEVGVGDGYECNRNFPLDAGITDSNYQPILETALNWLAHYKPQYLVLSLGLDTHELDPIADFQLTTEYYQRMSTTIAQLGLPMVVTLEGGYNTKAIGSNFVSFLQGLAR